MLLRGGGQRCVIGREVLIILAEKDKISLLLYSKIKKTQSQLTPLRRAYETPQKTAPVSRQLDQAYKLDLIPAARVFGFSDTSTIFL